MRSLARAPSRVAIYFEPRDIWVGVFISSKGIAYVCLVPCLVIAWRFRASPPRHRIRSGVTRSSGATGD